MYHFLLRSREVSGHLGDEESLNTLVQMGKTDKSTGLVLVNCSFIRGRAEVLVQGRF